MGVVRYSGCPATDVMPNEMRRKSRCENKIGSVCGVQKRMFVEERDGKRSVDWKLVTRSIQQVVLVNSENACFDTAGVSSESCILFVSARLAGRR